MEPELQRPDSAPGPLIALTASRRRKPEYYESYERAIVEAGGRPHRLLPGDSFEIVDFAGVLFPGGVDVEPSRYGQEPQPELGETDPDLDQMEIEVARSARASGIPLLGICRGMQILNVAFDGSLHQHLDGHEVRQFGRSHLAHPLAVEPGSELAAAAGTEQIEVNSLHHQVVADLAPGFRVSGRDGHGTIEAMESEDGLVVAVQCHPEELTGHLAWATALFRRFVDRAARRAPARA